MSYRLSVIALLAASNAAVSSRRGELDDEQHLVGARGFRIQFDAAPRRGEPALERRQVAGVRAEIVEIVPQIDRCEVAETDGETGIARCQLFETIAPALLLGRVERPERIDDIDQAAVARIGQRAAQNLGALMGIDHTERLQQYAGKLAHDPLFGGGLVVTAEHAIDLARPDD